MRTWLSVALGLMLGVSPAFAQAPYPSKPVSILVGASAGGPTDLVARRLADGLTKVLGQTFLVENKPSAGGIAAFSVLFGSRPDGYTLNLVINSTQTIVPHFEKNLPFNGLTDYTPISMVNLLPGRVLLASISYPPNNVSELVAHAQANRGKVSFGSSGKASGNGLCGEVLNRGLDLGMVHVPYNGNAPGLLDLTAGNINVMFVSVGEARTALQSGRIKAIGVTTRDRRPLLPDVPSLHDTPGMPDFGSEPWFGLIGPAALPSDVVATLNKAVHDVVSTPEFTGWLKQQGYEPWLTTPDEMRKTIDNDYKFWNEFSSRM